VANSHGPQHLPGCKLAKRTFKLSLILLARGFSEAYTVRMKEIVAYRKCFVCGRENDGGLKAKFFYDGERAITEVIASAQFEGYKGLYHGGILAALLDEVMIKAVLARGIFAVTAEMTIRYKRPIKTGERVRLIGKITSHKGRLYLTDGEALGDDDLPFATATGSYIEAKPDLKDQLTDSLE
jgi:uncharacterized protein (TIGR00369 family)